MAEGKIYVQAFSLLAGKGRLVARAAKSVCSLDRSSDYTVQFIRSLFVSVASLAIDFSFLIFLKQVVGLNYLLAATLSFCLGVIMNYILSVTWVFADRKIQNRAHEFLIFFLITGLGLLFNLLIIAGMVELLKIDYRVGKAVSTVVVFFWNFLARKKILY